MATVVVTTQPDPLVTLGEAKVALGESGNDKDDLIKGLILAAQAELDGPKGWVGITVAQQVVEVRFDGFSDTMRLPRPIIAPVVVTYLDSDGAEQTLDAEAYSILSDGRLVCAAGSTWPTASTRGDAVAASYTAGIEDDADPRVALMKTAIKMHVRMTLDGVDPDVSRRAIEALVRSMWVPVI